MSPQQLPPVIGASVRRSDGEDKVRGAAVYGMDHVEPGMLHARLLRSPLPAGRIVRLDTTRAATMPGVRAVVTAADAPHLSGWVVKDQRLMAADEVRYVGEPVAAVAADTVEQAAAAVAAIDLEIDPLPAILTFNDALASDARPIHRARDTYTGAGPGGGNVAWESGLERGAVEDAFAAADLVVTDEFSTPRQHQSPIEPHVAVGRFEQGRYVVHSPAQYPFLVRDRVAEFLGVRSSAVRVIVSTIGGGFGGKLDAMLEPFACLLARRTGRPVRVANTRAEELATASPRENAVVRLRTAVRADGTLLAQEGEVIGDNGAYSGETVFCASIPPVLLGATYRIPNVRYRSRVVYTNTTPTAAFRGVNAPYCVFAQEMHLDHIARELGVDRRELRLRNVLRAGEEMVNGQPLPDAALVDAFDAVEKVAPWAELTAARRPYRGVGIAAVTWLSNPGPGGATVKVNEDGTVTVVSGGAEIGTGAMATSVRQIVAAELGVPVEDVLLAQTDTDSASFDGGAQGSRTVFGVGSAAADAAGQVREQLLKAAADILEAAPDDLELAEGHVAVRGAPHNRVPIATVASTALWSTGPIAATGRHIAPPLPFDSACMSGAIFTHFVAATYHVHLAEVEVDPDTGAVRVLRYVVAQDVGRAINPQMIEGQIEGGVLQGLGYALFENLRADGGRVVDDDLESYRLPTALDAPPLEISLLENPCSYGPFGGKGVAEPPIIPVAAALGAAVADAIGRPVDELPMTPFAVLAALRGGQDRGGEEQA
jgi:CO/xanthine dehydrogenase Mo-binding subunit